MPRFRVGDIIVKNNPYGEAVLMVLEINTYADYDLYYKVLQIKSPYNEGVPIRQYAELYARVIDATYNLQS